MLKACMKKILMTFLCNMCAMKKLFFAILMVSFTLMGVSCQKENEFVEEGEQLSSVIFTAIADDQLDTKATLQKEESGLKFIWQTDDAIRLCVTKTDGNTNYKGTLKSGENTNSATFSVNQNIVGTTLNFAIFPYDNSGYNTDSYIEYPSELSSYVSGSVFTPMIAAPAEPFTVEEGATYNDLYFNHVGGALKFTLKNVPAKVNSVVFTAAENISGKFFVNMENVNAASVKDGSWKTGTPQNELNTVTFNFTKLTSSQDMVFYVPVLAGVELTSELSVDVRTDVGSVQVFTKTFKVEASYTVKRAVVADLGEFTVTNPIPVSDDIILAFPDDNKENNKKTNYTSSWTAKTGEYDFTMANFNNNNWGWTHVRCGRKDNNTSVATIVNTTAIPRLTRIEVSIDAYAKDLVNAFKLEVYSDAACETKVGEVDITSKFTAAGTAVFDLSGIKQDWEANYYKIIFDLKAGSTNGFVQVSKVVYKVAEDTRVSLAAPTISSSSVSGNVASLEWAPVTNAAGYEVYANGVKVSAELDMDNNPVVATVKELEYETEYSFTVVAIPASGSAEFKNSEPSAAVELTTEASTLPELTWPAGATFEATVLDVNKPKEVTLTWTAVENAASYEITYGSETITVKAPATTTTVTCADLETEYTFSIVAKEENHQDSEAKTATVTTLAAPIIKATVAEFLAAEVSAEVWYELTGTISNIASTQYGNFTLSDGTNSVFVYGLTATKVENNNQSFASLNLEDGYKVTIKGLRGIYSSNPSVGGFIDNNRLAPAYYVSHVVAPVLKVDKTSLSFEAAGAAKDVIVTVLNTSETPIVSVDNNHFTPVLSGNKVTVTAPANETTDQITGTLTISVAGLTKVVTLTQAGKPAEGGTDAVGGNETFTNMKSDNSSYATTGSFIGDNGEEWTFKGQTSLSFDGKCLTLRKKSGDDNYVEGTLSSAQQSSGVGTITFEVASIGSSDTGKTTYTVAAGSVTKTVDVTISAKGVANKQVATVILNSTDAQTIKITMTGTSKRYSIDNISWTPAN